MRTMRSDVEINKRQTLLPHVSNIGYSSWKLRYGDLFRYKEHYTDKTFCYRLAKCHGQIKPVNKIDSTDKIQWFILAQAASDMMDSTYERWIDPLDVVETLPSKYANKHILEFFIEQEQLNG